MKISYYARIGKIDRFEERRWYADELSIIGNLGYAVVPSVNFTKIPGDCECYISWWAQSSLGSVIKAKICKKSSIVIAGGSEVSVLYPKFGYNGKNFIKKALIKLTLRMADIVVAVSYFNKQEIIAIIGEQKADKVEVLYHCVSDKYFSGNIRTDFSADKYYFILTAYTEANLKRKCIYKILQAVKELKTQRKDINLIMAGTLDEKAAYQKLLNYINNNGIKNNIRLLTNISEEQKIHYLNNAYYYLQPTEHEQFGVALAEAMACGCPVISTSVAAVPEVVGNSGVLLKQNKVSEIADIIWKTYDNVENRNNLAANARNRALNNFTYYTKEQEFQRIIKKAIAANEKKK